MSIHRGGERQLSFANEIPTPHRSRFDAELTGNAIDGPLDGIDRFGMPSTAIRIYRHRIGENTVHFKCDRRYRIDAAQHSRAALGCDVRREVRNEGAQIGVRFDRKRKNAPVVVKSDIDVVDLIAAVIIARESIG